MPKSYWKQQTETMVLSMYSQSFPMNYTIGTLYPFENETQFIKHSGFDGLNMSRFGHRRGLNYGRPLNFGYSNWLNYNGANFGNVPRLPLKMRMVFAPSSSLSLQQSCVGPLAMPPFLFSRMSQPFYSIPLPPPLPQTASLYLENYVQHMYMQQYTSLPNAVPSISNWQMSQPVLSGCLPIQQQQQQSIIPVTIFNSYQSPLIPSNIPIFPSEMPLSSLSDINHISWTPERCNSGYPDTCRVCMPAQPSFNNSLTSSSSMQYCIYHQKPAVINNLNVRPTNERVTPLLRSATVTQNVHNQTQQRHRYSQINSWSRNTPPLPPGAIILSDEYINKNDFYRAQQPQRTYKTVQRSATTKTDNTDGNKSTKTQSLSKITKPVSEADSHQSLLKPKSSTPSRSIHSLSLKKPSISHQQPFREISDINLDSDKSRYLRLAFKIRNSRTDLLPSVNENSTKEDDQFDEKTNKSTCTTSSTPSQLKRSETKSTSIRETPRTTPSTIKTSSRATVTSINDKSLASFSIASK